LTGDRQIPWKTTLGGFLKVASEAALVAKRTVLSPSSLDRKLETGETPKI
jgi:hypothetical protein